MQQNGQNGEFLGYHLLVDFFGCKTDVLRFTETIKDIMLEAIKVAELTPVAEGFYNFTPVGVSGFIILAESHASIHTWPEHGLASVDFYTCGKTSLKPAIDLLQNRFGASAYELKELNRAPKTLLKNCSSEPIDR